MVEVEKLVTCYLLLCERGRTGRLSIAENWAAYWEAQGYTKENEDRLARARQVAHSRKSLAKLLMLYDTLLEDGE